MRQELVATLEDTSSQTQTAVYVETNSTWYLTWCKASKVWQINQTERPWRYYAWIAA